MPSNCISLASPIDHAVYQRDANDSAEVKVVGTFRCKHPHQGSTLHARIISSEGKPGPWNDILVDSTTRSFSRALQVHKATGWNQVEIVMQDPGNIANSVIVSHVGVGEVFVTAGQSNSANSGTTPLAPLSPLVSARSLTAWQPAKDPQPIAGGVGGSPWPPMADALVEALHVPVGLISVGVGGTPVASWMPSKKRPRWKWLARLTRTNNFPRLEDALKMAGVKGARAVLWHQGESDAIEGTSKDVYMSRLQAVIDASRAAAGWNIPWLVARGSFHTTPTPERIDAIVEAQKSIVDNKTIFPGPDTNDLTGLKWRAADLVHFNEAGLVEHGNRWAKAILSAFFRA